METGGTHPADHLPVLPRPIWVRDLVILVIPGDEVLQDGATLKDADGLPVLGGVGDGRDAAVGVDLEEPGLLLLVVLEADGAHLVLEVELLEEDGDLDPVRGVDSVEGDVCLGLGGGGHCCGGCCAEVFG